ncbi:MAG: hypothetical protein WBS18_07635 [Candidatus Acidiferrales bacterium]
METNRPYGAKGPGPHGERFEPTDASPSVLLKWALGLALVVIISFLVAWGAFDVISKMLPMGNPASPIADNRPLPPGPRLQAEPLKNLDDYCSAEANVLDSYGWVDQSVGTVRIPIDRAMDVLIDRGLPTRSAAEISAAAAASELPADLSAVPATHGVQGQCAYTIEDLPKENTSAKE